MDFEWATPDEFPADEAQAAKRHWAGLGVHSSFVGIAAHSREMAHEVLALRPRSVLEFGCNTGRNLLAIREADASVALTGVDINGEAVRWGRDELGLDLRQGDEGLLAGLPDDSVDVIFTVSVLDHLPDPRPALAQMLRVAAKAVLLLEPWLGVEGKTVNEIGGRPRQPYSYSWNYERLLEGRDVTLRPRPIVAGLWGPHYHLYLVRL